MVIAIVVFCLAQTTLAQALRPDSPLPTTPFADWKPVPGRARQFEAEFASPLQTGIAVNDTILARVVLPEGGGPFPGVLILHYWGAATLDVEQAMAAELASRGVAAVLISLPYHLERSPEGKPSGSQAIVPDPDRMLQTMTQAVLDARETGRFIASRPEFDASRVGIMGTSLGSLVAEVVYGVDARFQRAAFLLGGVDLAGILWRSPIVVEQRNALRRSGITEQILRERLASIEPTDYLSRREGGRSYVVGARYDVVIPARYTEALMKLMPDSESLWLDTGHYGGVFVQRPLFRSIADFFETEFSGERFRAPKTLYAPTIRLGIQANTATRVQIALGVDVWRSNTKGDVVGTLLATPRGPQFFLGGKLDKGLMVGATFAQRRTALGVFWSMIL